MLMIITVASYEGGLGKTVTSTRQHWLPSTRPSHRTRHPYCAAIEIRAATRDTQHCRAGDRKAVLLKEESIERATERMKRRNRRTDFSDLMQALLDAWLQTLE
jgi:hypothetical protein